VNFLPLVFLTKSQTEFTIFSKEIKMRKRVILISVVFFLLFVFMAWEYSFAEYVSIPAAAFKGATETDNYIIVTTSGHWYLGGAMHYISKVGDSGKLVAPVNFPMSYTMATQMRVNLFDYTNKGRIVVRLIRVDLNTGDWKTVFKVDSGKVKTPGAIIKTDNTGANRTIDNGKYAWFVEAHFINPGQDLELAVFSVRLEYN
jgi:hypothetical protein